MFCVCGGSGSRESPISSPAAGNGDANRNAGRGFSDTDQDGVCDNAADSPNFTDADGDGAL